jgi:hypothetical protein
MAFFCRPFDPTTIRPNNPSPWSGIHTARNGLRRARRSCATAAEEAVVVMVSVTVADVDPGVTEADESPQFESLAASVQASVMESVNGPPTGATVSV